MLKREDISVITAAVDKAMSNFASQKEHMNIAFVSRRTELVDVIADGSQDATFRDVARQVLETMEQAREVHEQLSVAVDEALARTKSTLQRYEFRPLPPEASLGLKLAAAVENYVAFGYVHTASFQLALSATLEEIYVTGSSKESKAQLVRLLKLGSQVAVDEASRYLGIDSVENLLKLLEAGAGVFDVLAAPKRSMSDMTRWLRAVRASRFAFDVWLTHARAWLVELRARLA